MKKSAPWQAIPDPVLDPLFRENQQLRAALTAAEEELGRLIPPPPPAPVFHDGKPDAAGVRLVATTPRWWVKDLGERAVLRFMARLSPHAPVKARTNRRRLQEFFSSLDEAIAWAQEQAYPEGGP